MYNLKKAKINQNFPITIINAKEQKAFIGVDGKSEQATRSGKNKFNKDTSVNTTGYITSYTYSNGVYTIIPTGTGNPQIRLNVSIPQGTYTLNSNNYLSVATLLRNNNGLLYSFENNYENQTFTINESSSVLVFNWANPSNTNPIILDLNTLQIEQGSTATSYEPYGVSPSPNYPSEIHSVADDVNLLNLENIENHSVNYYYENIGTNFQLKAGETYTLSFDAESDITPFNVGIGCGSSGNYQSDILNENGFQNGRISITFTPQNSNFTYGNYLALRFVKYNNLTSYKYSARNIKLQKGSTPTSYSPYNQGTVTIKQRGKNKFNYVEASDTNNTNVTQYRIFEIDGLKPNTQYNINNMGFTQNLNNQYCYLWNDTTYAGSTDKYMLAYPRAYQTKVTFNSNAEGKMYLAIYPTDITTWEEVIAYLENAQIEQRKYSNGLRTLSNTTRLHIPNRTIT